MSQPAAKWALCNLSLIIWGLGLFVSLKVFLFKDEIQTIQGRLRSPQSAFEKLEFLQSQIPESFMICAVLWKHRVAAESAPLSTAILNHLKGWSCPLSSLCLYSVSPKYYAASERSITLDVSECLRSICIRQKAIRESKRYKSTSRSSEEKQSKWSGQWDSKRLKRGLIVLKANHRWQWLRLLSLLCHLLEWYICQLMNK